MTEGPSDPWLVAVQGIAAVAQTEVEMGVPDDDVRSHVVGIFVKLGLSTREDMLAVAEEIRRAPQPMDLPAEEQESLRYFQDMLGVPPPEVELAAQLRAHELVLDLASRFAD